MPTSPNPGLRPLSRITASPENYPGGSGRCCCSWSFSSGENLWWLKFFHSACSWKGEEGIHSMLASNVVAQGGSGSRRSTC
jgi:hypothetical protein